MLSPHRDDAAFSLSIAIAAWLAQQHSIEVLNCFTVSDYAPYAPEPDPYHVLLAGRRIATITQARAQEDTAWSSVFRGTLALGDLYLKDAPLRLHCQHEQVCDAKPQPANFASMHDDPSIESIQLAMSRRNFDAVVCPLAIGKHVDHVTARDALLLSDLPHRVPCAFYEDLPYAARPGGVDEIYSDTQQMPILLHEAYATPPENASAAKAFKRKCAFIYASQIDAGVAEQIAGFCTRYQGRERLWANTLWLQAAELQETSERQETYK